MMGGWDDTEFSGEGVSRGIWWDMGVEAGWRALERYNDCRQKTSFETKCIVNGG